MASSTMTTVACAVLVCLLQTVVAQLNVTTPELAQRNQFPLSTLGFTFASTNTGATNNAAGTVVAMNLGNNQILATLPRDGVAQQVANYSTCTINLPHVHPRGTEIYYVISGGLTVGIAEEATTGRISTFNITAGQNAVIPQGLVHFVQNQGCGPVQLLQFFDNKDAGTIFLYSSLLGFPDSSVIAFTGVSQSTLVGLRSSNPGSGPIAQDPVCLQRCGIAAGPGSSAGASGPATSTPGAVAPPPRATAPTPGTGTPASGPATATG